MARELRPPQTVLDAATATGVSKSIPVTDYRNCIVEISTAGSADLTVQCKGSMNEYTGTTPDFSAAKSLTNRWDYLQCVRCIHSN